MTPRFGIALVATSLLLASCGTLLGLEETVENRGSPPNEYDEGGLSPDSDSSVEGSVGPDADADAGADEQWDAISPSQDAEPDQDAEPQEASLFSDPLSLPGLVLWLDPSKGIVLDAFGGVTQWADQSPGQHDARQATPELCPEQAPSSLGGNPGVRFPGDHRNLVVTDHSDLSFGQSDFLVELVFRYEDAPAGNSCWNVGQAVFAKVPQSPPFAGVVVFGNIPVASGVESKSIGGFLKDGFTLRTTYDCNDNQVRLVGLRRSGHTVELRINGAQEATATPPGDPIDVSASGRNILIGGRETAAQCMAGVIGDIVVVKGPTSQSDLESLEHWFKTRYGL